MRVCVCVYDYRLVQFCEECPSLQRTEVVQIIFPLLVHVYVYLFSLGHIEQGQGLALLSVLSV